jgi:hypothetical protein
LKSSRIFIIGLPRTGTTSICAAMLELGFSVAHTAYTQTTFDNAEVIADTPIFCDYKRLDSFYPGSKFIYLTRQSEHWLPSIKQLLKRMFVNVSRTDGGFNTIIKRCYQNTFAPFTLENIERSEFLAACYKKHNQEVNLYFAKRSSDILTIDISEPTSFQQLLSFLSYEKRDDFSDFEKLNCGGKVTAWKDLVHEKKIESTKNGRISLLDYLTSSEK